MTMSFLGYDVSDLCLGNPPLKCLSISATVADVLAALRNSEENFISVWSCNHNSNTNQFNGECECVGKVCMVDVICYLSQYDNDNDNDKRLLSYSSALEAPVSLLLSKIHPINVIHVQPSCSLLEAIDHMIQGAQNLVVPIQAKPNSKKRHKNQKSLTTNHNGQEFCWLTQEDIMRYLLGSIGLFSSILSISIQDLGLINATFDAISVEYHSTATEAIGAITASLADQTSVAVVHTNNNKSILIGEISPSTLSCCDETVAAAMATLSAGDLMTYIDCGGPSDELIKFVMTRLEEINRVEFFSSLSNSGSSWSDDETTARGKYGRSVSYSARIVRRAEAIVCNRKSSLVAVMIQAIAHRVNYVWVVEEEEDDNCALVGIVTFVDMLKVFRQFLSNFE